MLFLYFLHNFVHFVLLVYFFYYFFPPTHPDYWGSHFTRTVQCFHSYPQGTHAQKQADCFHVLPLHKDNKHKSWVLELNNILPKLDDDDDDETLGIELNAHERRARYSAQVKAEQHSQSIVVKTAHGIPQSRPSVVKKSQTDKLMKRLTK